MKRWICCLAALSMLFLGAGCQSQETPREGQIELNPVEGALSKDRLAVNLYFADPGYARLVGEEREIDIPVNESVEYAVLQALVSGPDKQTGIGGRLVNEDTEAVNISSSGDVLFITLSKQFLDWGFFSGGLGAEALAERKRLAIYSVVNTMVEVSGYPKVQLLVETDGSGTGQRIKLAEAGFGGNGVLEPLERNGRVVLTPKNITLLIFDAMAVQNYGRVFEHISYSDDSNNIKPDENEFLSILQEKGPVVENYTAGDVIRGADGLSAVVMMDYSYKLQNEEQTGKRNFPIRLVKENGLWRMEYEVFERLFLGDAGGRK